MAEIPDISDDRLDELVDRIQPIVRRDGDPYFIEEVDPRKITYTWDPTPTEEAEGLVPIEEIITYHRFGYRGFFKPSVAEVLAQIPEEKADKVDAFEIVDRPEDVSDLEDQSWAVDQSLHVATTRLYMIRQ